MKYGEPSAPRRGPTTRPAGYDTHETSGATGSGRSRLRLRAWPYEPDVGVVLPADHQAVPSPDDVRRIVDQAASRGLVALRTGALFPRAAATFAEAGFHTIDTLALLDVRLDDARLLDDARHVDVHRAHARTRPLRGRHLRAAATVDLRAFGAPWGNDAATLGEIRAATPMHRARRLDARGRTVAFCISGGAGRTGYLQRLAVDPDHQRRGLAALLVDDALRWMRRRGLVDAVVNTGVSNIGALALYERFGFHQRSEVLVIAERSLRPAYDVPATDDVTDTGR